jgi:glycosyltransferase involved in cell wall biosynthesis
MPVKDGERTLPWLLNSLKNQRFTDWELVAVDDHSSDGSYSFLLQAARSDSRIRVYRSPDNGIVEALNTALARARGSWMVRVDADDICHPDLLTGLHESTKANPDVKVHATQVRYFPRHALQEGLLVYETWINGLTRHDEIERDMFVECPMPHPTLTCPLEEVTAAGGYRDMGWPEDYDLVLRLWSRGNRFAKVGKELYFWRDTPDRLSRTDPRYSLEKFTEARIEFLVGSYLASSMEAVVAGAGPVGKTFARLLIGRGVRLRAFLEVNPAKLGKTIYGALVLPVSEAPGLKGTVIFHAVGQKGTREEARKQYRELGLTELRDYLIVS